MRIDTEVTMEQYIVFESNNQKFGLSVPQIEKVIEYEGIKNIPDASDYLLGYLQYAGKFLPIIDLNIRLYNLTTELKRENKVLVVNWKEGLVGLLVEKIIGIYKFSSDQYEEKNDDYQIIKDYMRGFFNSDNGTIIILDTDKIFTPEQEEEIKGLSSQVKD